MSELELEARQRVSLGELALIYLRLGFTAFGGPAAHVAMMHREFVEQRSWLTQQEFLDLLGAANLIPGPNSTELAIYIGGLKGGTAGLALAGMCFILPAMLLVGAIAWAYTRYGSAPESTHLLYGIKPVIVAIIVQALVPLAKATVKNIALAFCGLLAVVAAVLGLYPLLVILCGGALVATTHWARERKKENVLPLGRLVGLAALFVLIATLLGGHGNVQVVFSLTALFAFFLKVGSVLYGSGYVLLAYLNQDLVNNWGWLTRGQLLDAVAVGQFTPGPVFTTATFIGYLKGGVAGAIVATIGIFLPAFLFVGLSKKVLPGLRKSPLASSFMDGVNISSLAVMAVVSYILARSALIDWPTVTLALVSLAVLLRFRINSAWLVLFGGLAGLLLPHVGR